MDERYGFERSQEIADIDWIREASQRGECILTKDTAIARNPVEARIVHMCNARVVTVTTQRVPASSVLVSLIANEAAIRRWAFASRPVRMRIPTSARPVWKRCVIWLPQAVG